MRGDVWDLVRSKYLGSPHSSVGKESACSAGDPGSIPGLGRFAGEGIRPTLACFIASFSFLLFSLRYKLRV